MNRKGFTLIELLVVVAVLALLASIVFSNLGGAREGARISNALSFQSQTHSLLGSDLVGWWNFNEGDARDISGYDNHGTIIGATHTDGVPGTGGSALSFNGVGNYVDTSFRTSNKFNNNDPFNLSFFFNTRKGYYEERTGIVNNNKYFTESTAGGFGIGLHNSNIVMKMGRSESTTETSLSFNGLGIEIDKWYFLSFTFNGDDILLYIDGDQKYKNSNPGWIVNNVNTHFARNTQGGWSAGRFDGLITDVRIYSRALTAQEIQTLYAQTKDNYLAND